MVDVEQLLTPISDEAPCGEDLSYDADLAALETLIQGKGETQFSAAEEPNWKEVHKAALSLFERTKDLRVAMDLTLAMTRIDGWPGFAQGTALLRGMLEKYWAELYPRLDPDDNNDPTERMNLLATLSTPEGTFGDPLRFLERIRAAPLCRSGRLGAMSLAKVTETLEGKKGETGEVTGVDPAAVEAAFQDTPPDFLEAVRTAVNGSATDLAAIDTFISESVDSNQRLNLEALEKVLQEAKGRLSTYAPPPEEPAGAADADAVATEGGDAFDLNAFLDQPAAPAKAGGGAPGTITSREDVLRALDAVCTYYNTQEPSSPVPALLTEARKLVGMNYLQIIAALTPEATPQVKLTGETP